jgi:hypothetical protein
MRTLERLVEQRRRLVGDRNRTTNRLTAALKQYYPEVLDCFEEKGTLLFCDFLAHWPTPRDAKRARKATLAAFFREHHVRSAGRSKSVYARKAPRRSRRMSPSSPNRLWFKLSSNNRAFLAIALRC